MKIALMLLVADIMMMGLEANANANAWELDIRFRSGKRDAAYKAAAGDGVFTDEEIKSEFGVDDNGLAEFKEKYDVNRDGVVKVAEFEAIFSSNEFREKEIWYMYKTTDKNTTMINLPVVTSLLIVLAISLQPVEASRRCWCDARVNGVVIKDFGVIASCGGWCGCGNNNINRCGLTCDEKVQEWAATLCLQKYKGKQVRSHYKASSCKTGDGKRTFACKYCSKQITKRISYTCYKTVTQTVPYSCPTSFPVLSVRPVRPISPVRPVRPVRPGRPVSAVRPALEVFNPVELP